jgi:hypothetical protein
LAASLPFGSAQQPFESFRQAAAEAWASRFYGGIHYLGSIGSGNEQGRKTGRCIVAKILVPAGKPLAAKGRPVSGQ